MPQGQVLEFSGVTKRFGAITAVSDLSGRVEPGVVTGFLGPNGAGKTTSLRILLGLVRATGGAATIGGAAYADLRDPLHTVGAVLEASSFHPGRTAANHLRVYAAASGIPRTRVDEVLDLVGLSDAAGRKVGGFSLGMRQRLGLAYALLGDPGVLVLDEPTNGLDPEGIRWMRGFLRQLAREGRTVLISSHLLTEVQQTVDAILVIAQGRLVFQGGLDELADPSEYATVVDAPDRAALARALGAAGMPYELLRSGLTVRGSGPAEVGAVAAASGVALSGLQRRGPALEEVFLQLVSGERVHAAPVLVVEPEPAPVAEPAAPVVAPAAASVAEAESAPVAEPAPRVGSDAAEPDPGAEGAERDETSVGDVDPLDAADDDSDASSPDERVAAETVALAADLDAETGAPPGAATASGAAADAAWSSLIDGPDAETEAEASDETPSTDAVAPARAAFTVASTGVIDIAAVAAAEASAAHGTTTPEAPRPEPTAPAAFAVASTGLIDIVPSADAGEPPHPRDVGAGAEGEFGARVDDIAAPPAADRTPPVEADATSHEGPAPEDADPDVEQIGEMDDALTAGDDPWEAIRATSGDDADAERPGGGPKTDSDHAADAFFAAFDEHDAPAATESGPAVDGEEPASAPASPDHPDDTPDDRHPDHRDGGEQR